MGKHLLQKTLPSSDVAGHNKNREEHSRRRTKSKAGDGADARLHQPFSRMVFAPRSEGRLSLAAGTSGALSLSPLGPGLLAPWSLSYEGPEVPIGI